MEPEEMVMNAHRILFVVACLAVWACSGCSTSPSPTPAATPGASTIATPAATPGASTTATGAPSSTTATAAPSSAAIVLHTTPDNLGCDSIGIDYTTMTFHIDPAAVEQVSAMTDTGVSLVTYWPAGFTAGEAVHNVVRDATGNVVVTDGDVLQGGQLLHGYYVCLAPTKIYVMLARPGG